MCVSSRVTDTENDRIPQVVIVIAVVGGENQVTTFYLEVEFRDRRAVSRKVNLTMVLDIPKW